MSACCGFQIASPKHTIWFSKISRVYFKFPWVFPPEFFRIKQNPWVFQVFQSCKHPDVANAPGCSGRWTKTWAIRLIFKVDRRRRWPTASVKMLVYLRPFRPGLSLVTTTAHRPMASKSETWNLNLKLVLHQHPLPLHQNNSCLHAIASLGGRCGRRCYAWDAEDIMGETGISDNDQRQHHP